MKRKFKVGPILHETFVSNRHVGLLRGTGARRPRGHERGRFGSSSTQD